MKTLTKWMFVVLLSLFTSSLAVADASLYVSPTGSDSNDCATALTPCQHINAAMSRFSSNVLATDTLYLDVGNYYAQPYASDGGAPSVMDGKGTMDIEGFNLGPNGSLNVICSTQQINPAGLVAGAVDAGSLGSPNKYQSWVQYSIDGGWGNYAVDAGYAYLDGGVGVLNNNSLIGGFVQFTVGAALITAPIVSNDSNVINFVQHATNGNAPTAPNASSKFNVFVPASHIYSYPADGGSDSHSYSESTLWVSSGAKSGFLNMAPAVNSYTESSPISISYCDVPSVSLGANSQLFSAVAVYGPGSVSLQYDTVSGAGYGVIANNAPIIVNNSEIGTSFYNLWLGQNSTAFLSGNFLRNSTNPNSVLVDYSTATLEYDVLSPADGTTPISSVASKLALYDVAINQGNSTLAAITATYGSIINSLQTYWVTDGGAGFVQCGAGGFNSLIQYNMLDAGNNLYSLDNGVTWTTGTGFVAVDGGSNDIHATCNQGTGCCVSSY